MEKIPSGDPTWYVKYYYHREALDKVDMVLGIIAMVAFFWLSGSMMVENSKLRLELNSQKDACVQTNR